MDADYRPRILFVSARTTPAYGAEQVSLGDFLDKRATALTVSEVAEDPQHLRASGLQACIAEPRSFIPGRVLDPVRSFPDCGLAQTESGADFSVAR